MWIYWGIVLIMGVLVLISSGQEVPGEIRWYRKPFRKGAIQIWKMFPAGKKKEAEKEIARLENMLLFLCVGLILLPVIEGSIGGEEMVLDSYALERPEKGQGSNTYVLKADIQGSTETEEIHLELEERQYTEKEKKNFLKSAELELQQMVLGENKSADDIRQKISLPSELQGGEVTVQWIQNPEGLLDENGEIVAELPEKGQILTLTAILTCEEKEELYEMALHLYPKERTEEEQLRFDLNQALSSAKEESAQKSNMRLPAQVDGRNVIWSLPGSSVMGAGFLLVVLLAAGGYISKSEEFKKAEQDRKRQLILDYPDVVFKLGMLLNAGLTIENAFTRIAEEYQQTKSEGKIRWAYEEMTVACNEMKSGISEAKAYERFGRRCEHTCYIRLGTILSGSLQKSSEGMTKLLLDEAAEAMEERRQLAKKMGEEAGTKLLFPMILMLMVVLVILIVPAVLSF